MNVKVNQETGYLIIEDVTDGFEIIETGLYNSIIKHNKELEDGCKKANAENDLLRAKLEAERILNCQLADLKSKVKDLEEQNKDLQAKLADISCKLADALSSHEENVANWHKLLRDTAEDMFEVGKIRGYAFGRSGSILAVDELRWEIYEMWYADAMDNGTIAAIEAEAKRRIAERKRRRLQDHQDS